MTSEAVRQLVEREISGAWQPSNGHDDDLRRYLVTPVRLEYDDVGIRRPHDPAGVIRLWLVWEESPGNRDGYKIVFDERAGKFGLAVSGWERDAFLGYYGTFLETYAGM